MKKRMITPLMFLFVLSGFSQNLNFDVHGKYTHPIKKGKLTEARFMGDIIPSYPANWIMDYVSAEVIANADGKEMMATGTDNTLSTEQLNLLNSVGPGTVLAISIKYEYKNPVTGNLDIGTMNYSTTVVPETEAEYPGGHQQMTKYLKENAIHQISDKSSGQFQQAIVRFTVDKEGEIADAQVFKTSGDPKIDKVLLKAIHKMPKWIPAEDAKGNKVQQVFEFSVGNDAGC